MKRFLLYISRWELSTFILAPVISILSYYKIINSWIQAFIANFIGACIFFWVDRWIFKKVYPIPLWDITTQKVTCYNCGKIDIGYRIVLYTKYDKLTDKNPQYRCYNCAIEKSKKMGMCR